MPATRHVEQGETSLASPSLRDTSPASWEARSGRNISDLERKRELFWGVICFFPLAVGTERGVTICPHPSEKAVSHWRIFLMMKFFVDIY